MKIKIIRTIYPLQLRNEKISIIEPGIYEAEFNKNGAVSVRNKEGVVIGVKLDEFLFLSSDDRDWWISLAYPNIPDVSEAQEPEDD